MWSEINSNPNCKYVLELTKRRSKVQEKNVRCERALNLDQLKIFCETIGGFPLGEISPRNHGKINSPRNYI